MPCNRCRPGGRVEEEREGGLEFIWGGGNAQACFDETRGHATVQQAYFS